MKTPPPRVADSLASAGPRDVIHVDRRGRVRSHARARALKVAYWGTLWALVGVEAWIGYIGFGVPGLSVAAALGGYVAWFGGRYSWLGRAGALVVEEPAQAEAMAARVATGRMVPRRMRARAYAVMTTAANLAGAPERALTHCRASIRLWGGSRSASAVAARQGEVMLLTRLGRVGEARALMDALGDPPEADYLRFRYHTAELFLAFTEGRCRLDDDALHDRASFALPINAAAPLLALLAWAFGEVGDREMATLLRDEAIDRHPGDVLSKSMPDLQRWLDEPPPVRARVATGEVDDEPIEEAAPRRAARANRAGR